MQNCNLTLILSPYKLIITWKHSKLNMCLNLLFAENHYWAAQCPTEHVWKHGSLELLPGTRRGVPLPITGWDPAKLKPQRRFFPLWTHSHHSTMMSQNPKPKDAKQRKATFCDCSKTIGSAGNILYSPRKPNASQRKWTTEGRIECVSWFLWLQMLSPTLLPFSLIDFRCQVSPLPGISSVYWVIFQQTSALWRHVQTLLPHILARTWFLSTLNKVSFLSHPLFSH